MVLLDENCNMDVLFGNDEILRSKLKCKEDKSKCKNNCPIFDFKYRDKTMSLIFINEELIAIPFGNKKLILIRDLGDEIEEVLKQKENILSNVSHELLTPIAVLKMLFSELLDAKNIDPAVIEKMRSNIARLETTARSLVEACRKNIISLVKEPINIVDIIEESLKNVEILCTNKKVRIYKQIEENLPRIEGDRSKLVFLFTALLSNAIKFNRENGAVYIKIRQRDLGRKVLENEYVEVTIEDTGIGIPEEKLKYIFDPLYQAESKTTRRFPGVGMGLYTSKLIVDMHKGKIEIESKLNKGTKVTVLLPSAREEIKRKL